MKNSNDIRNRTHDPPTCSAVPPPAVLPRAPPPCSTEVRNSGDVHLLHGMDRHCVTFTMILYPNRLLSLQNSEAFSCACFLKLFNFEICVVHFGQGRSNHPLCVLTLSKPY